MSNLLKLRKKGVYPTRGNAVDHFDPGVDCRNISSGTFVNQTARIWNQAPNTIKTATSLVIAKREIRAYVRTLPIS